MSKNYIKDFPFAKSTLVLCLVVTCLWLLTVVLALSGNLNIGIAIALCSIFAYLNFTPMHEAAHGNIAGKHKKYKKMEKVIGHISAVPLFIPYFIFKLLHLRHHSFTNDPEKDPDMWVATRNPIMLFLKCFTVMFAYYYHALFKPSDAVKKERLSILFSLGSYFIVIFVMSYFNLAVDLMILWFSSAIIGMALLALVFDWLPHKPHNKIGRYLDTVIVDKNWLTLLTLWQNYHLIHHLYPRVPFYRYRKLFKAIELELEENGAIVLK